MSRPRSTEILEDWREEANAIVLPAEPPTPTRRGPSIGVAGTAVALGVLLVALLARGQDPRGGGPADGGVGAGPSASASASVPATSPTSAPASSESAIGTPSAAAGASGSAQACSASQFVLGKATVAPGYGTLGTDAVYVTQPIRNTGGDCVLNVPGTIGVASADGQFQMVAASDAGTATAFDVPAGASVSIILGAWWWVPGHLSGTGMTAPPCTGRVSDVSRVSIPFASDSLELDLGTVWREVCTAPATVSITVKG